MNYTVSITSQGQLSIPAPLRRKLGLNKLGHAQISEIKGKLVVEPLTDLLDLRGSLKNKRPNDSSSQIRRSFEEYVGKKLALKK